jgi:RimJ/RimL family protein N-acetyltransferase
MAPIEGRHALSIRRAAPRRAGPPCCDGPGALAPTRLRQHDNHWGFTELLTELETARLWLRPFRDQDLDPYAAMCADPEVMRYVGERGVLTREDAWRQLAMLTGHWQLRGFGMWAVEERATGVFVGRVGLHYPEGWPDRELAWALARPFWGRGYATEAARAALGEAFGRLGWSRVISLIDPANARSVRLAERLGERLTREATVLRHRVDVYALERSAFSAA